MVDGVPPELAPTLKRLRKSRGISQPEMVRRSRAHPGESLSESHVGAVESGTRGMASKKIAAVALALELTDAEHQELLRAAGHDSDQSPMNGVLERLSALEDRLARIEVALQQLPRATSPKRPTR